MLRTLPGAGEFTALVMLAEIGDISRFGSARKLASWAGLTPTVRGTERIAGWSRGAPTVLIQNHLSVSTSTNPTAIGANIRSRGQGRARGHDEILAMPRNATSC